MSFSHFPNVKVKGVAAAVPRRMVSTMDLGLINNEPPEKFIKLTGVSERRMSQSRTSSDLCLYAAERIIRDLNWDRKEIDVLIFVSEFRDYSIPSTSSILQKKLCLSCETYCVDLTLGCSGWVYGLNYICSLLSSGSMKKGLLLNGESMEINHVPTMPLFGHAGAATAIEYEEGSDGCMFNCGTMGSKYDSIIVPAGGCRHPMSVESINQTSSTGSNMQLSMNGVNVFSFSVKTVPDSIIQLAEKYWFDYRTADYLVLHQANKIINDSIVNALKIHKEKVPYSIQKFGNTSSSSIPLTMVLNLQNATINKTQKFLCSGFGVGLSWGTVFFTTDNLVISDLLEIDE